MTKIFRAAVRGMCIGDSHLRRKNATKSAEISISHSIKQKDYLLYKKTFLERGFCKKINIHYYKTAGYKCCRISTTHKYLYYCHKWLYKPKKKITLKYLRKVSNEGVAFWYMDDGSLYPKYTNGKIHTWELVFSMYVTKREAEDAVLFFKERFGCQFTLKKNKGKYSIRCGKNNAVKFLLQIKEYIPECMGYKKRLLDTI